MELTLPCAPRQISVDPDGVLLDCRPANNHWKNEVRWRFTPLYTAMDEADVTNPHDRWSIIGGPWVGGSAFADPWYIKSPILGARLGAVRTQEFAGGVFTGYRTNDRNLVAGAEARRFFAPLDPVPLVGDPAPPPRRPAGPRLLVRQALRTADLVGRPAAAWFSAATCLPTGVPCTCRPLNTWKLFR